MDAYVEGALLFQGTADATVMSEIMRDLLACLVSEGMRYFKESDLDLHLARPEVDQRLADKSVILEDDISPYPMRLEPRYAPTEKFHFVRVLSGSHLEPQELETEWARLRLRLRQMVGTVQPTAAIAFGWPVGNRDLPDVENMTLAEPPFLLASWTYLSHQLLSRKVNDALDKVVHIKIERLKTGIVVRLGDLPGQPYDTSILRELKHNPLLKLFDPMVKQ